MDGIVKWSVPSELYSRWLTCGLFDGELVELSALCVNKTFQAFDGEWTLVIYIGLHGTPWYTRVRSRAVSIIAGSTPRS